jgi:hypothetical protein
MSSIAVFLVLGGATALAASTVAKNSVGSSQLKKNSVCANKIKEGSITTAKPSRPSPRPPRSGRHGDRLQPILGLRPGQGRGRPDRQPPHRRPVHDVGHQSQLSYPPTSTGPKLGESYGSYETGHRDLRRCPDGQVNGGVHLDGAACVFWANATNEA